MRHVAATLVGSFLTLTSSSHAEVLPPPGVEDSRIRTALYSPNQVYHLQGFVGYQIDLEFEPGETFVGLASGDIEGLSFVAQDNHLFLKPKVATVGTNLTVLTSRRHYHIDYWASEKRPDPATTVVIYSLRFRYPARDDENVNAKRVEERLDTAPAIRVHNTDYWYCGSESIRPTAASDDGVHTSLRFGAHAELPAIFVRNDDGSESLLNFNVQDQDGEVIIHRVARRFTLRRGALTGCIVNKGYNGSGERLNSGTIAPDVQRDRKGVTQ
jgi:type IV secretion system protein VirB9